MYVCVLHQSKNPHFKLAVPTNCRKRTKARFFSSWYLFVYLYMYFTCCSVHWLANRPGTGRWRITCSDVWQMFTTDVFTFALTETSMIGSKRRAAAESRVHRKYIKECSKSCLPSHVSCLHVADVQVFWWCSVSEQADETRNDRHSNKCRRSMFLQQHSPTAA